MGIERYEFNNFNVYPNPTKGLLNIKGANLKGKNVQIFSVVGQVEVDLTLEGETTLDLNNIQEGVYFIKINGIIKRVVLTK